ncbi:hypothetical protein ACRRTK_018962 [Alexandromys fortis]
MAPSPCAHLRSQSLATAGCGHEAPAQREEHLTPGMELSPLISKQLLGDPLEKFSGNDQSGPIQEKVEPCLLDNFITSARRDLKTERSKAKSVSLALIFFITKLKSHTKPSFRSYSGLVLTQIPILAAGDPGPKSPQKPGPWSLAVAWVAVQCPPPPYAARERRHPGGRQGRVSPGEPRRRASRPVLRARSRVRAAGGSQPGHAAEDARKEPAPSLSSGPEQTLCPAGAAGLRLGKGRRCCRSRRPTRDPAGANGLGR